MEVMSVNATFAVAARTRKVSRRPCTCPMTGNILILHKPLTPGNGKSRRRTGRHLASNFKQMRTFTKNKLFHTFIVANNSRRDGQSLRCSLQTTQDRLTTVYTTTLPIQLCPSIPLTQRQLDYSLISHYTVVP